MDENISLKHGCLNTYVSNGDTCFGGCATLLGRTSLWKNFDNLESVLLCFLLAVEDVLSQLLAPLTPGG